VPLPDELNSQERKPLLSERMSKTPARSRIQLEAPEAVLVLDHLFLVVQRKLKRNTTEAPALQRAGVRLRSPTGFKHLLNVAL